MKKTIRTIVLAALVLPLTGCLDAGLKYRAERSRENNPPSASPSDDSLSNLIKPVSERLPQNAEESNPPEDGMSGVDPGSGMPSAEEIQKLLESLKDKIPAPSAQPVREQSVGSLPNSDELKDCNAVNVESCDESENTPVCAEITAQIGEQDSTAKFEFKNACSVCKSLGENTEESELRMIGFREGSCGQ